MPFPAYSFVEIDKLTLKFTWNCRGPRTARTTLRRNKVGLRPLSSKLSTEQWSLRQCGLGPRTDVRINKIDLRIRNKPTYLWSTDFQQGCQVHPGGQNFFSANGAGTIGWPCAKEWSWTLTWHPIQQSAQNGSQIWM